MKINNPHMNPSVTLDDTLHEAVKEILKKVGELHSKLCVPTHDKVLPEWLNVSDLQNYLPSHPKKQTIYSWTCSKKIPFHKKGRSIMFAKHEIDAWLEDNEHVKSLDEIENEAKAFISSKSK